MKSCLSAFRSLSNMEKSVECCELSVCPTSSCLVLQLHCKHGMLKTYNIPYMEHEDLKAIFSKSARAQTILSGARTLTEVVANFQMNQEEVTFIASPEKIIVKNYIEDDVDANKALYTEMTLKPEEFESYGVKQAAEITFCLKELRAILAFAESLGLPLEIQLEAAGIPVMIFVRSETLYEGSFVLATLAASEDPTSSQAATLAATGSHSKPATSSAAVDSRATTHSRGAALLTDNDMLTDHPQEHDVMASLLSSSEISVFPVEASGLKESSAMAEGHDMHYSKAIADQQDRMPLEEAVPGTPPNKKFKSYFLGLSQQSTSFHASQYAVLAEDTDDENENG